jgi:ribosomal protein S13
LPEGNSPRESYRKAYDVGVGTSEATVIAGANKLMKDSRIGALVEPVFEAVKQTIIDDAIATKRFVLEELHSHATSEENRASDRIKALELMGKSIGLFLDKADAKAEKVDAEKLKKELDVHLKTFKLRAV